MTRHAGAAERTPAATGRDGTSPSARTVPVRVADTVTYAAATTAALVILATGGETGARAPDLPSVALLVLAGIPLLLRRRWPVAAFGAMLAVVMTYLALDYPGGAELPLILAGLYGISVAGRRRWTAVLAGLFVGVGSAYRILVEGDDPQTVTIIAALFLLTTLLGDSVHARRALRAETHARLRAAGAERESVARARVAEERLRIARELHDVMAHTITTMSVQANAASDLLRHRPERAQEPLAAMRGSARDAMNELQALVRLLREPDQAADRAPQPRLDQLDELLTGVRSSGVGVALVVEGKPDSQPPAALDLTSYRIVQEALTNVVRHAGAEHAEVRLTYEPAQLRIQVNDDGRGAAAAGATPGYGLRGLRERASAVGGSLGAGPRPGGGFRVEAVLPLEPLETDA